MKGAITEFNMRQAPLQRFVIFKIPTSMPLVVRLLPQLWKPPKNRWFLFVAQVIEHFTPSVT